jgi:hypothetical protein
MTAAAAFLSDRHECLNDSDGLTRPESTAPAFTTLGCMATLTGSGSTSRGGSRFWFLPRRGTSPNGWRSAPEDIPPKDLRNIRSRVEEFAVAGGNDAGDC